MKMFEIMPHFLQHKMAIASLILASAMSTTLFAGVTGDQTTLVSESGEMKAELDVEAQADEIESIFDENQLLQKVSVTPSAQTGQIEETLFTIPTWTEAVVLSGKTGDEASGDNGKTADPSTIPETNTTPETYEMIEETVPAEEGTEEPIEMIPVPSDETEKPVETPPPATEPEIPDETPPPATEPETPDETPPPQSGTEEPTEMMPPPETEAPAGSFDYSFIYNVLDIVNARRAESGLPGLTWNETLAESARIRATEIVTCWSHTRPDGTPWYTAGAQLQMGENLAYGQTSPEQVMDEWMASEGHAQNILESRYSQIGIACYIENGTYYWVQHFA
jgi:uncharacterized protein YkwD